MVVVTQKSIKQYRFVYKGGLTSFLTDFYFISRSVSLAELIKKRPYFFIFFNIMYLFLHFYVSLVVSLKNKKDNS